MAIAVSADDRANCCRRSRAAGVRIVAWNDLERVQQAALGAFFRDAGAPGADAAGDRRVAAVSAALVAQPQPGAAARTPRPGETEQRLAIVQVPPGLTRLVQLAEPGTFASSCSRTSSRAHLAQLFPGQPILESAVIRLARDAELELDDEGGRTQLELVERELRRRRRSDVVRLEVERRRVATSSSRCSAQQLDIDADDVYCRSRARSTCAS